MLRNRPTQAAIVMFGFLALSVSQASGQSSGAAKATSNDNQASDPVTRAVQQDTLTRLRIAAIALDGAANQAEALSGIVGAFLKRGRLREATIDFKVIADTLWQGRAMMHFAAYESANAREKKAQSILRRAAKLVDSDLATRDDGESLALISRRQGELDDFVGARATARRMPTPKRRIAQLLALANMQNTVPDKAIAAGAKKTFRLIFAEAKAASVTKDRRLEFLIALAQSATDAKYFAVSAQVLDHAYGLLRRRTVRNHTDFLARVAAAYVDAKRTAKAMDIVRSLKDDASQARTLASIARAIALGGSVEGAAPLFLLALQDTESITEPSVRNELLTHIIEEQTRSGLFADAFSTAGKIKHDDAQRRALFAMGRVLLANGKAIEAEKLVHYLPDMGMRAQIYASAARARLADGDREGAAKLLSDALAPTGTKPDPATMAKALPLVFEVQVELGPTKSRDIVFARIRRLLDEIPDGPAKVPVMTRLARAEMLDNQKEAADRSLSLAWRISWFNKDKAVFPELLSQIAAAHLAVGDVLPAFDTAARIPDASSGRPGVQSAAGTIRERPKIKALIAVAVAAAKSGQGPLALRAARKIADPTGRASAYNAIALALPIRNQEAKRADDPAMPNRRGLREQRN